MKGQRMYKCEKLCGVTAIDSLLGRGADNESTLAYPLRAVWMHDSRPDHADDVARFVIVVPKRRLRHAVDRVKMRRRIREAYRLSRHLFPARCGLCIGFVYVADTLCDYRATLRAMQRILTRISRSLSTLPDSSASPSS